MSSAEVGLPEVVRRLDTPSASALAGLTATFEDLQTVLRCCERLMAELSADGEPDEVVVEGAWTTALLSYARCFAPGEDGAVLSEADLTATHPGVDILDWHRVLLHLRDHYADPVTNPREQFSVGVAQDSNGAPSGIAITSTRQPLVDDLTVRQAGAIAFTLSGLVNDRIVSQQEVVFDQTKDVGAAELDSLVPLEVARPDTRR